MLTVLTVCLLVGCATTFKPWSLSEVQEGMERSEVIRLLGEPDYVVNKNGSEYLYYSYQEEMSTVADVTLESPEGLERRIDEFNRKIREYKYEVVLVDGKLINYKELQN